ncbi:hypothetical protein SDC9_192806 [bioreactor metagenome]|uniref:Uncharacterized protein n=1 Tax=bioreactor metagenome TaxID=1076179 RepID=A0A645I459_9ZZZZ
MHSKIRTVNKLHRTETKKMIALTAVIETTKRYRMPVVTAGAIRGSVTLKNVVAREAPKLSEASSIDVSICCIDATIARIPAAS